MNFDTDHIPAFVRHTPEKVKRISYKTLWILCLECYLERLSPDLEEIEQTFYTSVVHIDESARPMVNFSVSVNDHDGIHKRNSKQTAHMVYEGYGQWRLYFDKGNSLLGVEPVMMSDHKRLINRLLAEWGGAIHYIEFENTGEKLSASIDYGVFRENLECMLANIEQD